jgi:glycosyltransferase involved in cell wall biosynthesis
LREDPFKILHVEAGPTFGGSTSALESYLLYGDKKRLERHVLFHHRVPGIEAIEKNSHRFSCLDKHPPGDFDGPCETDDLDGDEPAAGAGGAANIGRRKPNEGAGPLRRFAGYIPGARPLAAAVRELAKLLGTELPLAIPLAREAKRRGYDIIHSNNTPRIQVSTLLGAALAGVPVITHVRTSVEFGWLQKRLVDRCRLVIAQSSSVRDELERQRVRAPVVECFDGVSIPARPSPVSDQVKGELLGVTRDAVIGAVGRLVERKGFKYLIDAMPLLLRKRPNLTLAIVGEGPLKESLQRQAASLGLADKVRFLGFRRDLRYVLQAIDVFALPSLKEGLPITLLIVMAEGRPVVASAVDGVPTFVHHDRTGLLVPPKDPEKLAEAIARLLDDRSLAAQLGSAGRALAAREASVRATAAKVDKLILGALGAE